MLEYSVTTVLIGTILGFLAGTGLTWTSPEIPNMNNTATGPFNGTLTEEEASWIGGLMPVGAIFGPFMAGYLADKIGRKYTILSTTIPFAMGCFISAFAKSVTEFYIARFVTGLAIGGAFTILPMYVAEMSLDKHRGVLGSNMNVFICFGLFFTYIVGSYIPNVTVYNLFMGGITVSFFILFLIFGYESPHWYMSKRKYQSAKKTLRRIRDGSDEANDKEYELIKTTIESESRGNVMDIFRSKGNTKGLIISCGLLFFQQTTGICAVLFYAQAIFEKAGTTLEPMYCSMIIGFVQFITSFITPLVSNRYGRKILLSFSGIGMFLSECLLGIYSIIDEKDHNIVASVTFLPVLCLVMYIFTYNVGFGPLPWAIMGEIFPTNVKSTASAMATATCWITSFMVTKYFGQLVAIVGQGGCFIGFAVANLVAVAFTYFCVLETKGKTLVEIQEDLNR